MNILWGFIGILGVAFLCFAIWYRLSPIITLCRWKNSNRAAKNIALLTIISATLAVPCLDTALDLLNMTWWVALVLGFSIGFVLFAFLYRSPKEWREATGIGVASFWANHFNQ